MNTIYKFRAECMADVLRFLGKIEEGRIVHATIVRMTLPTTGEPIPDVECTIEIDDATLTLSRLHTIAAKIPDGHIMARTIAIEEEYDGSYKFDDV